MSAAADLALFYALIRSTLSQLLTPLAAGGMDWQRAQLPPDGAGYTLPRIVSRARARGEVKRYIGMPLMWEGEIIVTALAADLDGAETLARTAAETLPKTAELVESVSGDTWDLALVPIEPPAPSAPRAEHAEYSIAYTAQLQRRAA